jgi:hypothetical protein
MTWAFQSSERAQVRSSNLRQLRVHTEGLSNTQGHRRARPLGAVRGPSMTVPVTAPEAVRISPQEVCRGACPIARGGAGVIGRWRCSSRAREAARPRAQVFPALHRRRGGGGGRRRGVGDLVVVAPVAWRHGTAGGLGSLQGGWCFVFFGARDAAHGHKKRQLPLSTWLLPLVGRWK